MWTRKASLMVTSGISLILIGMMISNFQLMIVGLTFISFLAINGWVSGHSELEVTRTINGTPANAINVYKGDDVVVQGRRNLSQQWSTHLSSDPKPDWR